MIEIPTYVLSILWLVPLIVAWMVVLLSKKVKELEMKLITLCDRVIKTDEFITKLGKIGLHGNPNYKSPDEILKMMEDILKEM